MKKLLTFALIILALTPIHPIYAHGDVKPKHGGIVQTASDLSFELVDGGDGVVLHIEDHDKPISLAGSSGKLTLMKGTQKSEFLLVIDGVTLKAKGAKIEKGNKVIAAIVLSDKKTVSVRFVVK